MFKAINIHNREPFLFSGCEAGMMAEIENNPPANKNFPPTVLPFSLSSPSVKYVCVEI